MKRLKCQLAVRTKRNKMNLVANTLTILGGCVAVLTGLVSLHGTWVQVAGAGALMAIALFFITASSIDIALAVRGFYEAKPNGKV